MSGYAVAVDVAERDAHAAEKGVVGEEILVGAHASMTRTAVASPGQVR